MYDLGYARNREQTPKDKAIQKYNVISLLDVVFKSLARKSCKLFTIVKITMNNIETKPKIPREATCSRYAL